MPVPVHELATTEQYLAVLGGYAPKFAPDEDFAYYNGGYVILALLAERASGVPFHEFVRLRVCEPAGMADTGVLPLGRVARRARHSATSRVATARGRTCSTCRCPGRGTAASTDGCRCPLACGPHFFAGGIVLGGWVTEMVRPRSDAPDESKRYGLGFWLRVHHAVILEGM